MKHTPKNINHAPALIAAGSGTVGILLFFLSTLGKFVSFLQIMSLLCIMACIYFLAVRVLPQWDYHLTDPDEEYPYGRLLVSKRMGTRIIPYADLDLAFSVSLLSKEESEALAKEKNLPPFQKTVSAVKNMFARDVYELFIGFRAGNARLLLEIGDVAFLSALKERVAHAVADDARAKKLRQIEEEYEAYGEAEEWDSDPLDSDLEFQKEIEKTEASEQEKE